jgi:hypothetical protein
MMTSIDKENKCLDFDIGDLLFIYADGRTVAGMYKVLGVATQSQAPFPNVRPYTPIR